MTDMEPMVGAVESTGEESTENSAEQDLETLTEAEAIKADPTRMEAVTTLATQQGIPVPGETATPKSFKDTIKGIGKKIV